MITAVDTNILLDVLLPDPVHQAGSLAKLHQATQEGSLIVGEVVACELGAQFSDAGELQRFLKGVGLSLVPLALMTAHDAGQRWRHYLRTRKGARERVVADFMIAAHAVHHADRLLTRDLGFYRSHFKDLKLMS